MSRANLRSQLSSLDLSNAEEIEVRDQMLALLRGSPHCFERNSFPAHFTGSALVVDADGSRVMLHYHRKLNRWLQFGGHCDGDEDVLRVARREALEESGIWGLRVASEIPIDLDIHEIPSHGPEPKHFHYDVRYLLMAPKDAVSILSVTEESLTEQNDDDEKETGESGKLRWFTAADLEEIELDDNLRRLITKGRTLGVQREQ